MTDRLRGYGDSIRQTLVTMAELELIFAKARFAVGVRLRRSRASASACCCSDARHPLLEDVLRRRRKSRRAGQPGTDAASAARC